MLLCAELEKLAHLWNLILTATVKVKNLREIVALLGVSGRIGKSDTQTTEH